MNARELAEKHKDEICSFENALVFTHAGILTDSFDIDGMQRVRDEADEVLDRVSAAFIKEQIPYKAYGCGACRICSKCTCPDSPCRHPEKAIVSIEACGVNVLALAHSSGLSYNSGADTVTYFSMITY